MSVVLSKNKTHWFFFQYSPVSDVEDEDRRPPNPAGSLLLGGRSVGVAAVEPLSRRVFIAGFRRPEPQLYTLQRKAKTSHRKSALSASSDFEQSLNHL